MGKALELLKQLNVVEFDWKDTEQHDIGLIAEDVAKVIPEAVYYNNEGQIEGLKPLTLLTIVIEAVKELEKELDYAR